MDYVGLMKTCRINISFAVAGSLWLLLLAFDLTQSSCIHLSFGFITGFFRGFLLPLGNADISLFSTPFLFLQHFEWESFFFF